MQRTVAGRYVVHDAIASGGMATVHFGRLQGDEGFARTVAVKMLHPQFARDPEFVAMLLDEARISARVRHPNVVPTLDVVSVDGQLLVVMDYVHGESVARLLSAIHEAGRDVPLRVAVAIATGVLHGLQAAHEATTDEGEPLGIVHRDVSPQNVLVGGDGCARVVDFGVAKAAGRLQTTSEGQVKGKVAYMAPEQLRGLAVDARADVYALGVVLWEMLTGARLFSADSAPGTMTLVLEKRVETPSTLRAEVAPELDQIVLRAVSRDPARRFPDAAAMASALEALEMSASAVAVGAWVRDTAKRALDERAATRLRLESQRAIDAPAPFAPAAAASPAAAPGSGWSGRTVLLLAAASVLTAASAAALTMGHHGEAASLASLAPAAPAARPALAAPVPSVTAAAGTTSTAVDLDAAVAPADKLAASRSPATSPAAPAARRPPVRRAVACSPPYTLDASGFHIPKPQCL